MKFFVVYVSISLLSCSHLFLCHFPPFERLRCGLYSFTQRRKNELFIQSINQNLKYRLACSRLVIENSDTYCPIVANVSSFRHISNFFLPKSEINLCTTF